MTDAEVEAQKARVEKLLDKWRDILWLEPWRFTHTWHRAEAQEDMGSAYGKCADVRPQWQYLCGHFNWYLPVVAGLPDEEIDEYVAHEFLHVVLAEIARGKQDPHEERVVTHLARAFCHILKDKKPVTEVSQEVADAPAEVD